MKILMIGNSYTYYNDMPLLLEALCRENGKDVTVTSVTKGARRLMYYQNEDPTTLQLRAALAEGSYDVCFLQEQSVLPAAEPQLFYDGVRLVEQMTRDSVGKYVFYSTWGRKKGHSVLEKHGWSVEEMTRLLADAYRAAAEMLGADRSPVGEAFLWMVRHYPQTELFADDGSHPSYEGSCLATMLHYQTLFGELPKKTETLHLSPEITEQFFLALSSDKGIFSETL